MTTDVGRNGTSLETRKGSTAWKALTAIAAAGLLALAQPMTAQAATATPQSSEDSFETAPANSELEHVQTLVELTTLHDNTPVLDVPAALAAGIDQTSIDDFQAGLATASTSPVLRACVGSTALSGNNTGGKLLLGSCQTNVIAGVVAGGGTVAGVAGAIFAFFPVTTIPGLVTAIAGGIVALGAGWLGVCNAAGEGVRLEYQGVLTCQSQ